MTATFPQAYQALKDRMIAAGVTLPIRYQNEGSEELPEDGSAFVFFEVLTERNYLISFGGGVGNNTWRTDGRIEAHVYVPRNDQVLTAAGVAEMIAVAFRGFKTSLVTITSALVQPGNSSSYDGNYWVTYCVVGFYFDTTG